MKTPKVYLADTGLLCFLLGLRTASQLHESSLLGGVFETHVLTQMIRHQANRGQRPSVYFYRDHDGHEVDFVVPEGEKLRLIEVKWSESPRHRQPGFDHMRRQFGAEAIKLEAIITPRRGPFVSRGGILMDDSVELRCLASI